MDLGLHSRVAIVAASSQGLGKAVALGLAREGARLALCARTEPVLLKTAEEIRRETGAEVLAEAVDVTAPDQVRRFQGSPGAMPTMRGSSRSALRRSCLSINGTSAERALPSAVVSSCC